MPNTALATNVKSTAKITVKLETSDYGNPQPTLRIALAKGTHYRVLRAALLRAASEIELATHTREGWIVVVTDNSVHLELLHATDAEAARGMALLQTFAK